MRAGEAGTKLWSALTVGERTAADGVCTVGESDTFGTEYADLERATGAECTDDASEQFGTTAA